MKSMILGTNKNSARLSLIKYVIRNEYIKINYLQ